jgi:hypothetical protein
VVHEDESGQSIGRSSFDPRVRLHRFSTSRAERIGRKGNSNCDKPAGRYNGISSRAASSNQRSARCGALRRAKEHLEHSAHDFGGHRVEALRATDEAIRQLEICLKYDKE